MISVALALVIDAATGEPQALWRRIPHPVILMGRAIDAADNRLNRGNGRRLRGALALALLIFLVALPAWLVALALSAVPGGVVVEAALASIFIAHRSLHQHVAAVAAAPSLEKARAAVAMIVGRDVSALDDAGVARASLETLSESLSDGVVAPAFWFALLGLPGIVAYKLINTADSMIGHRTPRHEAFGWAAARLDDAMNIVPARLTVLLTVLAAPRLFTKAGAVIGDARRHVSPNAGWPEAAFAHALGIALGGPRRYGTRVVEGAWLNKAGATATRADIRRGVRLSAWVGLIQISAYVALAFL
ncbi:MAG: adenosylcobinamide-phosphate synthase CbiB [Pseudomonadota bacterium]